MPPKVALIGDGNVGSALKRGLERAGWPAKSVGHEPQKVRELAEWGEVVVLAVPFPAVDDALDELGDAVDGKVLVDVTNVVSQRGLEIESRAESGAERIQSRKPQARVVKAFNTVFAGTMENGKVGDEPVTLFVAADDAKAKDVVIDMGRDLGFDPVNAGPLQNARWMEGLGYFHMQISGVEELEGKMVEFRLLR